MTYWNLSFDIIAMFFFVLIFVWYFSEKKIPLRSHRVFLYFLTAAFLATGLEILSTLMARNMNEVGYDLFYFTLTLQTFAINLIPMILSYYLLLLAHINIHKHRFLCVIYLICLSVDAFVIILNPVFKWAFTFENDTYKIAYVGIILYFIDLFMVCMSIFILIKARINFLFLHITPLIFNIACCLLACIAQIFFYIPVLNCTVAAACLTLFHYQQNSGNVTDAVTGSFNRKFMGEYIQNKFMTNKSFGIIVVALDDFKFVNKTYGVETGDHLLYQVAQSLEREKADAMTFRLGSDQFCLVLNRTSDNISSLAENIRDRFHHPWYDENQVPVMMSASICCINCPEDAASYRELVEVIDYSMSVTKKTRKGLVTHTNDLDIEKIKKDKAIERAVRLAMAKDELMVYYQPIYSVTKGAYNSAEALVRLNDPELGWVSPEAFIPISEKNGLIVEMGEIILRKVCHFIQKFNIAETSIEYIEVNISPIQLIQPDFVDRAIAIIEEYNVLPNQINMEITETATVSSSAVVARNIQRLVEYGIAFSLDDYGSGNANISYINKMPFKIIKIDKCLIWDSFKSATAGITLEYTIGMLNALKLHIVAEGIETEEMKSQLADFGCHFMQGWYYSKAVPDNEFIALLEASV